MNRLLRNKAIHVLALATLTIVTTICATPASAQGWDWGGFGANYPYGLYGSRINEIPYFSLFPPVYYSMPVPRTYGWSPFAYPPGTMTPEVVVDNPQDITNPYVPQSKDSKPAKPTARTASYRHPAPQLLINQYVNANGSPSAASTQIASK
jgi:hypothetical protein